MFHFSRICKYLFIFNKIIAHKFASVYVGLEPIVCVSHCCATEIEGSIESNRDAYRVFQKSFMLRNSKLK